MSCAFLWGYFGLFWLIAHWAGYLSHSHLCRKSLQFVWAMASVALFPLDIWKVEAGEVAGALFRQKLIEAVVQDDPNTLE